MPHNLVRVLRLKVNKNICWKSGGWVIFFGEERSDGANSQKINVAEWNYGAEPFWTHFFEIFNSFFIWSMVHRLWTKDYGAIFDLVFIPVWTFRSVTIIDFLCVVFSHRSISFHGANWMERSDWVKYQNSGGAGLARSLRSDPLQFHSIAPQIKMRSLIVAREFFFLQTAETLYCDPF